MIGLTFVKRSKRQRAENWSEEERSLLRSLVHEKCDIIDNKCTDTATNLLKLQAWKEIWEKFVSMNQRPRTVQKLREQWKRMKVLSRNTKKKNMQLGDKTMVSQDSSRDTNLLLDTEDQGNNQNCNNSYTTLRNGASQTIKQAEYKCVKDSLLNHSKPRNVTSKVYQTKNSIEYKRSMLELNKTVKEQIMNCAFEEHQLRMKQLREEHNWKMQRDKESHTLHCENERLRAELLRLDIELRNKQLNDYVI